MELSIHLHVHSRDSRRSLDGVWTWSGQYSHDTRAGFVRDVHQPPDQTSQKAGNDVDPSSFSTLSFFQSYFFSLDSIVIHQTREILVDDIQHIFHKKVAHADDQLELSWVTRDLEVGKHGEATVRSCLCVSYLQKNILLSHPSPLLPLSLAHEGNQECEILSKVISSQID